MAQQEVLYSIQLAAARQVQRSERAGLRDLPVPRWPAARGPAAGPGPGGAHAGEARWVPVTRAVRVTVLSSESFRHDAAINGHFAPSFLSHGSQASRLASDPPE